MLEGSLDSAVAFDSLRNGLLGAEELQLQATQGEEAGVSLGISHGGRGRAQGHGGAPQRYSNSASLGSSWPEEEADLKPEEALAATASSDPARPSSSPTALPLDSGRSSGGVARWQAATAGCDARSSAGEASQSSSSVAPFFSYLFR
jgi:hypothetical protein